MIKNKDIIFFQYHEFTMTQTFYIIKKEITTSLIYNIASFDDIPKILVKLCDDYNIDTILIDCDIFWYDKINQDLAEFKYIRTEKK